MSLVQGDGSDWQRRLEGALGGGRVVDLVGLGNTLRGDDAVGLEILSRLRSRLGRAPKRVRLHPQSPMPERLLSRLSAAAARVIVFDAVEASKPPGTIVCSGLGDTKYGYFATHNVPLRLIPGLESRLEDYYIVGVQPQSMGVGEGLSEPVSRAADRVVGFIAREVGEG